MSLSLPVINSPETNSPTGVTASQARQLYDGNPDGMYFGNLFCGTDGHVGLGTRGTPINLSLTTGRVEPIQLVVNSNVNPTGVQTMNLIYADLETSIAQADARLKVADWAVGINHALTDAYVAQMELDQAGAGAVTGQMCTLSATMQIAGTAVIGEAQALYVSVGGAGACTCSELTVAKFVDSHSGSTLKAVAEVSVAAYCTASAGIMFDGQGTFSSIFSFNGLAVTTPVPEDNLAAPNKAGSIAVIMPSGSLAYINVYDGTRA